MKALVLSGGASHGAFQAGVFAGLEKVGWTPDLICGSSVGSINGTAWASGKGSDGIIDLWENVTSDQVYKWRPLKDWFKPWTWNHIFDTSPLMKFLEENINFDDLYESDQTVFCYGTDVLSGNMMVFSNRLGKELKPVRQKFEVRPLDLNSVMSSSALPIIFPWVDGVWDGSFQPHHPLKPAILMGAEEIVVVHLCTDLEKIALPDGLAETAFRIINLASTHQLIQDLRLLEARNHEPGYRKISTRVISPDDPFDYSKLNFDDASEKRNAVHHGYIKTLEIFDG